MIGALIPVLSYVLRHSDGQQSLPQNYYYYYCGGGLIGGGSWGRPLGVAPAGHPALRPVLLVVGAALQ